MAETAPCVKGSIFASVVDDVKQALRQGRLSTEDLESKLGEKDRALMESVVTAVSWIPIDTYGRLLELLAMVEGGSHRDAYLRDRGARAAERLLAGTYGQFDSAPGTWGRRAGELMVGIASVLYNFTRWTFSEVSPGVWQIVACEARHFPDVAAHTAHGFLEWYVKRAANGRLRATLSRPTPDRIVFELREA
jgi:hypothetical protein